MKKSFILLLLSLLLTPALSAQNGERVWTLEECMQYAVENSPKAIRQQYTNDNYRQDQISAIASMMPSVSGSVGTNWSFGRSIDPETNTYATRSTFNNSYYIGASLPLFRGFAAINNLRMAKVSRLRGEEEWEQVAYQVALATMQAYFDVLYYTEAVNIASEQLQQSRANLTFVERQAELGLKGRPEVVQIEAEVANYEYMVVRQENLLEVYLLQLKDHMNYPLEEALQIDRNITLESNTYANNAEQIYTDALEWLPQALIAGYQLREYELAYSIAKGQQLPSLSASGSFSSNYFRVLSNGGDPASFRSQLNNNLGKGVGMTLSIPIFNGLNNRIRINRARNNLRMAEQTNTETMRQLQSEIEQAVMDAEGSSKEYAQAAKKLVSQQEAHRANQRKFEEGMISALELQSSNNGLLQARVDLLQVQLQYRIKCKVLDYYKGVPLVNLSR